MDYALMKKRYLNGWHTWNVRSVLSHVHMPDGLALNVAFKEYREGHYLKETLVGRFTDEYGREPAETAFPGIHAFDDSYTEMSVEWCDMVIKVESAVIEDELILLITPVKTHARPAMLVLEGGFLWGKPGWVEKSGQTLITHTPSGERVVYTSGQPMEDSNIPVQTAFLAVSLDRPVAFSTGTPRSLEEAQRLTEHCKKAHEMKTAGFMAALGSPELAYSNLREILNEQTKEGFVPNFAYATGQCSSDRSQPPVGSAMLLETYRIHREKWIVEDMYPALLAWNLWFAGHRMNDSGALCWGSERIPVLYGNRWETDGVNSTFGAALESGLDNSPMYDDVPFNRETNRLELEDVGLTGLYILDCRSLIELAKIIGKNADIPGLLKRMEKACRGLENLWDEENGFYYNRRTDTKKFSRRISPTNFYALFSPYVSSERQRRMADEHYYNPDDFYGEWMMPSIARTDAA